jgi:hypothetical protein
MTSTSLLEKGRKLYELGEYEQATVSFEKAKYEDRGSNRCEILYKLGMSLLYLGQYKEAERCADEALGVNDNDGRALAIKAEALNYLGHNSDAEKYADKAICSSINDYDVHYAWFLKGYALDYSGDHDKAILCFDIAIGYCGDEAVEASTAKGIALNYKKCYNDAEICFDRAIEIGKKNIAFRYQDVAYAYLNKSVCLYNLGRNGEVFRGQLIKRRYLVLDERAETHKHKFVIQIMINNFGEKTALEELGNTSIIYGNYKLDSVQGNSVILTRNNTNYYTFLEPRKVVRIIGKEEQDIPLLASVSEKGFVKEVDDSKLVIDLEGSIAAERAKQQLSLLPLTIIPDEINLTRRVLEPMHRFHKLAADVMLPPELWKI